ncbi:uncharacterized protein LOC128161347 isoform X2 [Crassostrea angulata]|uniref:uncharacterized protein LOC128161347 isoform X2 n=1 Tax=Magallana angulata TaxID=2784310 RepID=UPI0022B17CD2|nr:uncharacterized protein LOC128161347 isoform X2 [Crassostrea angulata]
MSSWLNTCESQNPVNPGTCSNVSNGEPLVCCPNYRIVGTSCEECWPGFRGVNCAEDCAKGFYGRLCREKCLCDPCDKVKGCQNITLLNWNYTHLEEDEGPTRFHWFSIQIVSFGGFVVFCILCLSVFCIFRLSASATSNVLTEKDVQNDKDLSEKLPHSLSQKTSSVDEAVSNNTDSDAHCNDVCQRKDCFPIKETDKPKALQYYHIDLIDEPHNILKLSFKNDLKKMKSETQPFPKLSHAQHNTFERKRCREAVGLL